MNSSIARRTGFAAALAISVMFAWPSASALAGPINLSVPKPTGKYRVGTRTELAIDRSRDMGFGKPGKRKLMIQLFYPRAIRSRSRGKSLPCLPSDYAPRAVFKRLQEDTATAGEVRVKTGVCMGGQLARGLHPVIVASHAFAANRTLYTSLAADLASRGFVVAVIDHTYEAFAVRFPAASLAEGVYGGPINASDVAPAELSELEAVRSDDASFALTFVNGLSKRKSSPLWRHVDRAHSGIFGHSLGGATSFEVAHDDARFDASVNLDGEVWNSGLAPTNLATPHLLLLSEGALRDTFRFTLACAYYQRLTGPKQALLFTDTKHYAFSDFQALAPQILEQDPDWPLGPQLPGFIGTADPDSTISLERKTLAKFFKFYLGEHKPGAPKLASGTELTPFTSPECIRTVP